MQTLVARILFAWLLLASAGCLERYEVAKINDPNLWVVEDGELRHLKTVGFVEVGILRTPFKGYMFEDCDDGHEAFTGDPPCWPGKRTASSRQIRRLVREMPDYRDHRLLETLARRYPPDERVRVVLGTRPLIVGIESRRAQGVPGFAYIAQEGALHLPIVALVVHPDFGGVEQPVLVEFPEPMAISDVLDQLGACVDWKSLGEARTLPLFNDPTKKRASSSLP